MATGQGQGGGLFALPDMPSLGPATWADMSGVHPDDPLVGGRGAIGDASVVPEQRRRVALASPSQMPVGQRAHATELFNFAGSPMPWLLLAALAYFGLVHLHLAGRLGPYRASAGVSK